MKAKWDGRWWRCTECGALLPDAPVAGKGLVDCPGCGASWYFDYWSLNRWLGDRGCTGLVPVLWTRKAEGDRWTSKGS